MLAQLDSLISDLDTDVPSTSTAQDAAYPSIMLATPRKRSRRIPLPDATVPDASPPPPLKLARLAAIPPCVWGQAAAAAAGPADDAADREAQQVEPFSPPRAARALLACPSATPVGGKRAQQEDATNGLLLATPPPPVVPIAIAATPCFVLPKEPTARRLFHDDEDEEPQQAEQEHRATNIFLANLEKQGRDRFAELWGFDIVLGQPLANHPRFEWEAVSCA